MKSQVKDESIRIYCSRPWKHKIKQLATIENQSISNYITSMVDRQLTENISPHNQSNNNDVLELLIVSLFQGLYNIKNRADLFEQICSYVYREKEHKNE